MSKEAGLNNYELFFFKKTFGTNLERLKAFRKAVSKRQKHDYRGESYCWEAFRVKGNKLLFVRLSRKKIDAYVKLISENDNRTIR